MSQKRKVNRPTPASKLGNSNYLQSNDNSDRTQQARILKYFLTVCPRLSSMKIRDDFAILHPPGRIKDLRDQGHRIILLWVYEPDLNDVMHDVGMYVYCGKDDLSKNFWNKVVESLSDDSEYWEFNKDRRYTFLKDYIAEGLKPDEYDKAIRSLCNFLGY